MGGVDNAVGRGSSDRRRVLEDASLHDRTHGRVHARAIATRSEHRDLHLVYVYVVLLGLLSIVIRVMVKQSE
jgi:hypothetical protein